MSKDEAPNEEHGEIVSARIRAADVIRLDQAAARRGVDRSALIAGAIDEFLAQEAWSGGFIAPPPPMQVPRRNRDRARG